MGDKWYYRVDYSQMASEGLVGALKEVRFTVEGEPIPKARPRVVNGHAYTPDRTKSYEQTVAWAYKEKYHDFRFEKDVPLSMVIDFYFKPPKSTGKKKYQAMIAGDIRPTKRLGDIDNMAKSVLDSGNKVIWEDDSQIVELICRKFYGERARAEVYITEALEGDGW